MSYTAFNNLDPRLEGSLNTESLWVGESLLNKWLNLQNKMRLHWDANHSNHRRLGHVTGGSQKELFSGNSLGHGSAEPNEQMPGPTAIQHGSDKWPRNRQLSGGRSLGSEKEELRKGSGSPKWKGRLHWTPWKRWVQVSKLSFWYYITLPSLRRQGLTIFLFLFHFS